MQELLIALVASLFTLTMFVSGFVLGYNHFRQIQKNPAAQLKLPKLRQPASIASSFRTLKELDDEKIHPLAK